MPPGSMPASPCNRSTSATTPRPHEDEPVRLDTLQLDVGLIGPAAGGEFVQNNFHRLIDDTPVDGLGQPAAQRADVRPHLRAALADRSRCAVRADPKLEVRHRSAYRRAARQRRDLCQRRRHAADRQGPAQRFRAATRAAGAARLGRLRRRRASAGISSSASTARRWRATSFSTATPTATASCTSPIGRSSASSRRASPCSSAACASATRKCCARRSSSNENRFDQFGSINVTFRY